MIKLFFDFCKILVRRTSEIFYVRFNKCVEEIVNKFALSGLGRRNSVLVSRRSGRRAQDCGSNVWAEKKNRGPDSLRLDSGYLQTRPSSLADVSRLHPRCLRTQLSRLNMASFGRLAVQKHRFEERLNISLYLRVEKQSGSLRTFCRGSNLHQYGLFFFSSPRLHKALKVFIKCLHESLFKFGQTVPKQRERERRCLVSNAVWDACQPSRRLCELDGWANSPVGCRTVL